VDVASARRPRLFVLPFMNTSGDPGQDYFASAMTDEIIAALAVFPPDELAVIARTTSFHYKDTRKDLATIGRELRLDYVVEGGARRGAEQAILTVQLIRVSDQAHVWASRYEAKLDDLFATERAVAEAVGAKLGLAPDGGPGAKSRKPTENLEALTLFRQGRHYLLMQTPENFAAAKRCFEQAIERDPGFALAHDALAVLWWYYDFMGFAPSKTVAGIGMAYALRALELDSSLAETHALLGHFRWLFDYDWPAVRRHIDRARELNPASPMVRVWYAMGPLLAPECRVEEAIDELLAAAESDPLSALVRAWLSIMFHLDRQYDRAIEESRLIVEMEPKNYVGLAARHELPGERALRRGDRCRPQVGRPVGWLDDDARMARPDPRRGWQGGRGARRARGAAGGGRPPGVCAAHLVCVDVLGPGRSGQRFRVVRSRRRGLRSNDGPYPAVCILRPSARRPAVRGAPAEDEAGAGDVY
jgi:TolB-like protein